MRSWTRLAAGTSAAAVLLVGLNGAGAATAATTVVDDRVTGTGNGQLEYSGGWLWGGSSGMWASTDHHTSVPGSTVRLRFSGTDVQLTGSTASDLGAAYVSIDGGRRVLVSQRGSGVRRDDVVFFDAAGNGTLPAGQHTLTLTTASRSPFTLDRAIVTTVAASTATPVVTTVPAPGPAAPVTTTAPTTPTAAPVPGSSAPATAPTTGPGPTTPVSGAATSPTPAPTTAVGQLPAAAPSSTAAPATSGTAAPVSASGVVLTPEQFGANGSDLASDTVALQAALDALRTGDVLYIAAGKVYRHDRVLVVRPSAAGAAIDGPGTIMATAEDQSALKVYAPDFRIDHITRRMESTTSRGTTEDHHSIFVSAPGYRSKDVTIDGSHAAGYFFFGASDFVVERPVVRNTRADGIHMTYGSHNGKIISPLVQDVGDDGVAVVSYAGPGFAGEPISHDIEVVSPRVLGQSHGRGLSVVGGEDVTFSNVYVQGSAGAGILIGVEANTNKVRRVKVLGGELVQSNSRVDIDQGAVFLISSRPDGSVEDVTIDGLTMRDTLNGRGTALKTGGTTGAFARILIEDMTASGPQSVAGFYPDGSIPPSSYGAVRWSGADGQRLVDRGTYRG